MELLERRVLAPGFATECFTIEGCDGSAQLLLEVGVEQHAVVDDEAGSAVEAVDQGFLAVAAGGYSAVERYQAFDRWILALAFDDFLGRHPVDAGLHAQLRHGLTTVQRAIDRKRGVKG